MKTVFPILKILTGLAIFVLVTATITIMVHAVQQSDLPNYAYIGGKSMIAVMHEEPRETSAIVTALKRGEVISLLESEAVDDWAFIRFGEATGWVEIEHLSLDPP